MRLIFFWVVEMEATITRILMVLHTTTVELGMPNTLLLVVKPPTSSRHCEWYVGGLSIYESQSDFGPERCHYEGMILFL